MEIRELSNDTYISYKNYKNERDLWQPIVLCVIGILSVLATSVAIGRLITKPKSPTVITMISLLLGDTIFSLQELINCIFRIVYFGWRGSFIPCLIMFPIGVTTCLSSTIHLVLLSFVRMNALSNNHDLSNSKCTTIALSIWLFSAFITIFPIFTGSYGYSIVLQSSLQRCEPNFMSRQPLAITFSVFILSISFVAPGLISYFYYRVYSSFFITKNLIMSHPSVYQLPMTEGGTSLMIREARDQQLQTLQTQERRLVVQSLLIVCSTLFFWLPVFVSITIKLALQMDVEVLHLIYNVTVSLNCLVDPLIILFFETK